ncbi:hypothetical protein [Marinicrinis sediminis]|uniref:Uncharacterized protein n=1 Tax=Marinicrinis sediminis TaxID=1652465 RepID=A0ABW5R920_9BACL
MKPITLTEEWIYQDHILILPHAVTLHPEQKHYFVIDFSRKFTEPDLRKLPAMVMSARTKQEKYIIHKYNVVLGEVNGDV